MIEQIKRWVKENCIADGIDAGIDGPALDVDAFLAYLDKLDDGWISVDKELAKRDDSTVSLLFKDEEGGYGHGYGFYSVYHDDIHITYDPYRKCNINAELVACMPLPSPPKQESNNE